MYTLYVYESRFTYHLGRANCVYEDCFETMKDLLETKNLIEKERPGYMFEIVKEG